MQNANILAKGIVIMVGFLTNIHYRPFPDHDHGSNEGRDCYLVSCEHEHE